MYCFLFLLVALFSLIPFQEKGVLFLALVTIITCMHFKTMASGSLVSHLL